MGATGPPMTRAPVTGVAPTIEREPRCAVDVRDFAGFERRMTAHYRRLDALGVGYRPPTGPLPWQRGPGVLGRPIEGAPPNR